MRNSGLVVLFILLGLLLLIGVGVFAFRGVLFSTPAHSLDRSMPGDEPAKLPSDWPLAYLKLPPDAIEEYLIIPPSEGVFDATVSVNRKESTQNRPIGSWWVGFDANLSWQDMCKFIDDSLRGHEFLITRDESPEEFAAEVPYNPGNALNGGKTYISTDGLTEVQLWYHAQEMIGPFPGSEGYQLNVITLETPRIPVEMLKTKPIPPASAE